MCNPVAVNHPELVLETGEHAGHQYQIVGNEMGYRCGYVRVGPDHPWHGKHYDDVSAEVHGGLTFSAADTPCDKGGADNGYWLGFDCAHAWDLPDPALPGYEQWPSEVRAMHSQDTQSSVKTQEYVRAECHRLCEQASEAMLPH